jgi:hypothetical protein
VVGQEDRVACLQQWKVKKREAHHNAYMKSCKDLTKEEKTSSGKLKK